MPKYRKKPVVIEALLWNRNVAELAFFMRLPLPIVVCEDGAIEIETLEGVMRANPGDWIIRGVKGELYPCKPDIFEATYEPA